MVQGRFFFSSGRKKVFFECRTQKVFFRVGCRTGATLHSSGNSLSSRTWHDINTFKQFTIVRDWFCRDHPSGLCSDRGQDAEVHRTTCPRSLLRRRHQPRTTQERFQRRSQRFYPPPRETIHRSIALGVDSFACRRKSTEYARRIQRAALEKALPCTQEESARQSARQSDLTACDLTSSVCHEPRHWRGTASTILNWSG